MAHMQASDASAAELAQQMAPLHRRWSAYVTDSFKLQGELAALRRAEQVPYFTLCVWRRRCLLLPTQPTLCMPADGHASRAEGAVHVYRCAHRG